MFHSSREAVMMLISNGALFILVSFFQNDLSDNIDLAMLSIDSFTVLVEDEINLKIPQNDILAILQQIGLPECLPPCI
jgi:hypothetical protein